MAGEVSSCDASTGQLDKREEGDTWRAESRKVGIPGEDMVAVVGCSERCSVVLCALEYVDLCVRTEGKPSSPNVESEMHRR